VVRDQRGRDRGHVLAACAGPLARAVIDAIVDDDPVCYERMVLLDDAGCPAGSTFLASPADLPSAARPGRR
jgi:hypothetical protein